MEVVMTTTFGAGPNAAPWGARCRAPLLFPAAEGSDLRKSEAAKLDGPTESRITAAPRPQGIPSLAAAWRVEDTLGPQQGSIGVEHVPRRRVEVGGVRVSKESEPGNVSRLQCRHVRKDGKCRPHVDDRAIAEYVRPASDPPATVLRAQSPTPASPFHRSRLGESGVAGVLLLLLLAACGKSSLTALDAIPPVVYAEWAVAQRNVAPYVGDRALSVTPDAFRWEEHGGKLPCPPDMVARYDGCFGPDAPGGPLIEWSHPGVLAHESAHAILWALRDARWVCVGHDNPGDPANFREECAP